MNAPSHQDCTDPRCMTCYMYTYRNGDADSSVKRALRLKLRKNENHYVAVWRERQNLRLWLRPWLNSILYASLCHLYKIDPQAYQYIISHRKQVILRLRKAAGDLSSRLSTAYLSLPDECHAYCVWKMQVVRIKDDPLYPWAVKADPYLYVFSKSQTHTGHLLTEIPVWLGVEFHKLHQQYPHVDTKNQILLFSVPLPNGRKVLMPGVLPWPPADHLWWVFGQQTAIEEEVLIET